MDYDKNKILEKRGSKKLLGILLIIGMSTILSYCLYCQIVIMPDDAAPLYTVFNLDSKGSSNFKSVLSGGPWMWIMWFTYQIKGMDSDAVALSYAVLICVCYVVSGLLSIKNGKHCFILPLLMWCFIPSERTNIYHLQAALLTMLFLWFLDDLEQYGKQTHMLRRIFVCIPGIVLLKYLHDFMLLGIFIIIPFCVYGFIYCLQNRKYHKVLMYSAVLGSSVLLLVRIIGIVSAFLGKGQFVLDKSFQGYGGSSYYTSWAAPTDVVRHGIPFLTEMLFANWNITLEGAFVQYSSVLYVLRIITMLGALIVVGGIIRNIVKKGINNIPVMEAMSAIIVCVTLTVNVINGTRLGMYVQFGYFPQYSSYASIVWFLLPVLLCRYVSKALEENRVGQIGICIAFFCFTLCFLPTIYQGRNLAQSAIESVVNYLEARGYVDGLGSFDYSYTADVYSGGKVHVTNKDATENDRFDSAWYEGYRKCNFVAVGIRGDGLDEEIKNKYGEYSKKEIFEATSGIEVNQCLYLFDYDVRWKPGFTELMIPLDEMEQFSYSMELPLGTTRVILYGQELDAFDYYVTAEDQAGIDYSLAEKSDTQIVIEVQSAYNQEVQIVCDKIEGGNESLLEYMETQTIYAAYPLVGSMTLEGGNKVIQTKLDVGEYIVTVIGEDLSTLELDSSEAQTTCEVISQGKKKVVYAVNNLQKGEVGLILSNSGQAGKIEAVYCELPQNEKRMVYGEFTMQEEE